MQLAPTISDETRGLALEQSTLLPENTGCEVRRRTQGEEKHLNSRDSYHEDRLTCVVDSRLGDSQLLGRRHHGGADH
jgi:hypothetical protein